jgi:hypothetical protein
MAGVLDAVVFEVSNEKLDDGGKAHTRRMNLTRKSSPNRIIANVGKIRDAHQDRFRSSEHGTV